MVVAGGRTSRAGYPKPKCGVNVRWLRCEMRKKPREHAARAWKAGGGSVAQLRRGAVGLQGRSSLLPRGKHPACSCSPHRALVCLGGVSLSTPAKRAGAKPPGRPIADRCGARGGRLAASVRGGAPSRREERPFFCLPAHRIRAPCFSRPPTPHHRRRVRAASVVDLIPLLPRCFETPEERARAHSFRRFPPGESRVEPLSSASTSSAICKERTPRGLLAPQPARRHRPERRARRKQRAAASPSSHLTSSNDGKGAGKKHIGCFHRLRLRREERSVW